MRFKRASMFVGTATAGVLALATTGVAGAGTDPAPAPSSDAPTASSTSSHSPTSEPSTPQPEPTDSSKPEPTDSHGGSAQGASLSVSPSSVRPGQHVAVRLSCLGSRGTPHAAALRMGSSEGAAGSVYTNATVAGNAQPGTHTVSANCAGKTLTATFTVPGSSGPKQPPQQSHQPQKPQVRQVPKGSVETGDGSLAAQR